MIVFVNGVCLEDKFVVAMINVGEFMACHGLDWREGERVLKT